MATLGQQLEVTSAWQGAVIHMAAAEGDGSVNWSGLATPLANIENGFAGKVNGFFLYLRLHLPHRMWNGRLAKSSRGSLAHVPMLARFHVESCNRISSVRAP